MLGGAQRGMLPSFSVLRLYTVRVAVFRKGLWIRARTDGNARYVGMGQNRWPFVHVDDLADLYLLALEDAPAGTLLLGVSGPSHGVQDVAARRQPGADAGRRTSSRISNTDRTPELGCSRNSLRLELQDPESAVDVWYENVAVLHHRAPGKGRTRPDAHRIRGEDPADLTALTQ